MSPALLRVRVLGIVCLATLAAVGCGKSDSPQAPRPVESDEAVEPADRPASSVDEPLVVQAGMTLYQLDVEGMHCQGCGDTVAEKLNKLPGVKQARVSFNRGTAWVIVGADSDIKDPQLLQAVEAAGYAAKLSTRPAL